jgi:hypothetical protein
MRGFFTMSNIADLGLDLENLFQPAWAQGKSQANKFEKFTGTEGVKPERAFGGKPGERRRPGAVSGPRREAGGFGGGFGGGDRRGGEGRPARGGGKFGDRKGGFRGGPRRDDRREPEPREILAPLPEFNVAFIPEEKGVEQLARQIKVTGRAYPLFQIALLILEKADRYSVQLTPKKKADGTTEKLFVCALDETPWTGEDEAVAHILKNHFATFYQTDKLPCDPPKGVYTFVAQCGLSGVILGPPNYHDYQNQLRKLHADKFGRMPFDVFKSRVKIVKDEAVVKKWVEEQSSKIEYTALNVPEPVKFSTLEEVEKHFRATHKDSIIKSVETVIIPGAPSRTLRCAGLQRLIRAAWEQQRHFPLPVATKLSQQMTQHGLQFFKVNKTVTHVSVARPLFLDIESSPVSDGIKRIVNFINSTPKCTRKKLIEALAPSPKPEAKTAAETPATVAEGVAAPASSQPAAAKAPSNEPTPEQTLVLVDLHWLIHAGAVLEFADGRMETAKKPAPKQPKSEKKADEKTGAAENPAEGESVASTDSVTPAEIAESTETVAPVLEAPASEPAAEAPAPDAEPPAT